MNSEITPPMFLEVNYSEDITKVSRAFLIPRVQEGTGTANEYAPTSTLAWTNKTEYETLTTREILETIDQIEYAPKIDVSLISSICMSTLVVLNIAFTLLFYLAWRKRKKATSVVLPNAGRQTQDLESLDDLNPYRTIEILDSPNEGVYINSELIVHMEDACAESLYDSIGSRNTYCSLEAVQPRDHFRRDKFKTLTTLFNIHSQDVSRTVVSLTRKDVAL
ncbi:uncharacterized protein LOC128158823 isoform X1 [Crassostrea angulata]|uniref:uncharacterized protein LOC128158823 isoform X1 n=1 Tax=Magallana angulata TaxID=2784310 RepID=UPI0022B0D9C8|nr:uncharacterized protein LOC128158823 isoform X1 [Crassostrea angulata]